MNIYRMFHYLIENGIIKDIQLSDTNVDLYTENVYREFKKLIENMDDIIKENDRLKDEVCDLQHQVDVFLG